MFKTHHAISRTVRDSASLFAVTEIQEGGTYPPVGLLAGPSDRRLRIAVSPVDVLGDSPEPAARAALAATVQLLVELGHEVTEVSNPVDGAQFYVAYRDLFLARTVGMLDMTDMRVATPDAKFGFPEIQYGMGGLGGATRLAKHLPRTIAMEMLLTGDYLTANEAKRFDLVNRVVPADDLMAAAENLAARVARHPTLAIQTEMEAFTRGGDLSQGDAVALTKTLGRYQMKLHEIDHAYDDLQIQRPEPLDLQ